jgi:hypothetical protein
MRPSFLFSAISHPQPPKMSIMMMLPIKHQGPLSLHKTHSFTSSASHDSSHTDPLPTHPSEMTVNHPYECPNIHCSINSTHTYKTFLEMPTPSLNTIRIQRFSPSHNPFPKTNCWEVTKKPLTVPQHGQMVKIERYGSIKLWAKERVPNQEQPNDWIVFWCLNTDGLLMAEIAIRKEWVEAEKKGICNWRGLLRFLLRVQKPFSTSTPMIIPK